MTSVFMGGSRRLSRLSRELRSRIDNVMSKEFSVLVGDANGADRAVQQYLHDRHYVPVVVYCTDGKCRNNVGGWPVVSVAYSGKRKNSFEFYTAKDDQMAKVADFGLMIWDGKSRGTIRNVENLVNQNKPTAIYYAPNREFVTVATVSQLATFIMKYAPELSKADRGEQHQLDLPTTHPGPSDRESIVEQYQAAGSGFGESEDS